MYVPRLFQPTDHLQVLEVIRRHPFALVMVGVEDGRVEVAQVPCVLSDANSVLEFHLARANPMSELLVQGAESAQLLFNGPDAYVSPTWYEEPSRNVPTWNYVSVLVRGRVTPVSEGPALVALLNRSAAAFEATVDPTSSWTLDALPACDVTAMLREIVGFSVTIEAVTGKFKLNQNRSSRDRERVCERLLQSPDARARDVAAWMQAFARGRSLV
jgi:transcriptional regulator